jgi:3-methylcrotonyl-CoA carboxylase alpha subunit
VLSEEAAAETANPWTHRRGWRLNGIGTRRLSLRSGRQEHDVGVEYRPEGVVLVLPSGRQELLIDRAEPTRLALRLAGEAVLADVIRDGEALHVFVGGHHQRFVPVDPMARAGAEEAGEDRLCAPMPGKVIALHAQAGQAVARGQALMVIEAMKMEHTILAPHDGVVEEVRYRVGDQVGEGATLISLGESAAFPAAAGAKQA